MGYILLFWFTINLIPPSGYITPWEGSSTSSQASGSEWNALPSGCAWWYHLVAYYKNRWPHALFGNGLGKWSVPIYILHDASLTRLLALHKILKAGRHISAYDQIQCFCLPFHASFTKKENMEAMRIIHLFVATSIVTRNRWQWLIVQWFWVLIPHGAEMCTVEVGSLHTLRLESLKLVFQPVHTFLNKLSFWQVG